MRWKRGLAFAMAVICCAGVLAGCTGDRAEEAAADPGVSLRNDGRAAKVVLGELRRSPDRTSVLEEIVEKYRADFPNTAIEVRSFDSEGDLKKALGAGELDIAEVSSNTQAAYVQAGLLQDIYPYLKAWEESATLTPAAEQAVGSLGEKHAYLIPSDFTQDLLYYRADWFDEYAQQHDPDVARIRSWDEIAGGTVAGETLVGASEKLGSRGGLAFAGKDKLVDYFNAMVWSVVGLSRIADPGAAYFSAEEGRSIFSLERAKEGADQFLQVMQNAALPEALSWTEEQALEAFQNGKAGMLLADSGTAAVLEKTMPQGSWAVEAFPRGKGGAAVFTDSFTGWGVSSSADDLEITAHFLTFLSNADNNTHYAKVCGTLPIHLEAADMEPSLAEGDRTVEMDMIKRGDWYQYASEPVLYRAYGDWREQADEMLRQFAAGDLSRDDLLGQMDGYWDRAYQEEGNLCS